MSCLFSFSCMLYLQTYLLLYIYRIYRIYCFVLANEYSLQIISCYTQIVEKHALSMEKVVIELVIDILW